MKWSCIYMFRIGIAYDTADMYYMDDKIYYDFAEQTSIDNLKNILNKQGYYAELVGNTENVINLISEHKFNYDLIYNTVEGIKSRNREGLLPVIFEAYNIPYIGTDAFGLSLSLNKVMTKILAKSLGILTPNYCCADAKTDKTALFKQLNSMKMPVIVKPNFEGNSSGISLENTAESAFKRMMLLLEKYKTPILCEEFIYGTEITVPVIGNDYHDMILVATTVDIQKNNDFWLDINCKIFGDYQNILFEVPKLNQTLYKICKKLFFAIGCRDFSRFDFRIDETGKIFFIEVNPLPALFVGGSFHILGKSIGLSYAQTIELIINTARKRLGI